MPRGIYSTRFVLASEEGEAYEYLVPEGKLAVVRDVDVAYEGGTEVIIALAIQAETGETAFFADLVSTGGGFGSVQWRGRQVCNSGETFVVTIGGDAEVGVAASGYLLTQ